MSTEHIPQKKWGQNFLRSRSAVERIVSAVEPAPDEIIVEIGPGKGALTGELARLGNRLIALEIDPSLAEALRRDLSLPNVTVIEADAVDWPVPEEPFRAVGNLPYNVATPILRNVLASPFFRRGVFMLQKEVADRIVASPGTEAYGFLSLYVRIFAEARILLTLGPDAFIPQPKVRSAVVVFDPVNRKLRTPAKSLIDLVSTSFRMRRKTLLNNLEGHYNLNREKIAGLVEAAGLPSHVRAETMTLDDFDRLAAIIEPHAGASYPRQRS